MGQLHLMPNGWCQSDYSFGTNSYIDYGRVGVWRLAHGTPPPPLWPQKGVWLLNLKLWTTTFVYIGLHWRLSRGTNFCCIRQFRSYDTSFRTLWLQNAWTFMVNELQTALLVNIIIDRTLLTRERIKRHRVVELRVELFIQWWGRGNTRRRRGTSNANMSRARDNVKLAAMHRPHMCKTTLAWRHWIRAAGNTFNCSGSWVWLIHWHLRKRMGFIAHASVINTKGWRSRLSPWTQTAAVERKHDWIKHWHRVFANSFPYFDSKNIFEWNTESQPGAVRSLFQQIEPILMMEGIRIYFL